MPDEILAICVQDQNVLAAASEFVELGIGVFFIHVEHDHVVLPAIIVVIAEEPRGEIDVIENKSAKIAVESLIAEARGEEIVIVGKIAEMKFDEGLLQCDEIIEAIGAALGI